MLDIVVVVLTLTLVDGSTVRDRILSALNDLQSFARSMPSCLRFDICTEPNSSNNSSSSKKSNSNEEVVVLQTWTNQAGLDAYYASNEFLSATPKFSGLLTKPPVEKVYSPTS